MSGFNLAMQDLDIRGAGNLLGSEQSGIYGGFGIRDLSEKSLIRAVMELKMM